MRLVLNLLAGLLPVGPGGGRGAGGLGLDSAAAFPWVPMLLLVVPAAVALGLLYLYFRTARRMRRAQLAPPVWLLPYLEQQREEPQVWPPTQSAADVAADLAERAESVGRLARRKRAILVGLALNFVAGWAMAGAYLYDTKRGGGFQELPSTSLLASSVDTADFTGLEQEAPGPEEPSGRPSPGPESLLADAGPVDTESERVTAGTTAVCADVDGVRVGLTICYDLRFPELYRALSAAGARTLFIPASFALMTGKAHWETLVRARAIENLAWVVAAGQFGKKPNGRVKFGSSLIVDPWGTVVARAREVPEEVVLADVDLTYQDDVRRAIPCLTHRRLV